LTKTLSDFCQKNNYEYQLNCIKDICYDKAITKYTVQVHMKIMRFNLHRPSYMMQGKLYDFLFVNISSFCLYGLDSAL